MKLPSLDEKIPGCTYFTWREALWLPQWKRAANEQDGLTQEILDNLTHLFQKLDKVRVFFAKPISVHVAYRSPVYNALPMIKGAKNSAHVKGMAVDFHVVGIDCDTTRSIIMQNNMLEEWGMRMEQNPGGRWIHLDTREPGPSGRYFKP